MYLLILYLCFPALIYISIEAAFSYKGCLMPREVFRLFIPLIGCDLLFKLGFLWIFDEFTDYLGACLFADAILLFYNVVSIYLNARRQNLRVIKKFPSDENYTLLAVKLSTIFCIVLTGQTLLIYNLWVWVDPTEELLYLGLGVVTTLFFICYIVAALLRLDRLKVPAMRSLISLHSNVPPMVLLRSFELDKYTSWANRSFDEEICGILNINDTPVVSLADPDQILPTGGSLKIQSKDEYWKSVVEEVLSACRAIILVEGDSNGLNWEIERVHKIYSKHPEKVFILIPANRYRRLAWCVNEEGGTGFARNLAVFLQRIVSPFKLKKQLDQVWIKFRDFISQKGFDMVEKFPGDNRLIGFNAAGKAYVFPKVHKSKLFDEIYTLTGNNASEPFDYAALAKRIESFEVNGFMKPSQIEELRKITGKLCGVDYSIAGALLFLELILYFSFL